jgi:hypothetical protein
MSNEFVNDNFGAPSSDAIEDFVAGIIGGHSPAVAAQAAGFDPALAHDLLLSPSVRRGSDLLAAAVHGADMADMAARYPLPVPAHW